MKNFRTLDLAVAFYKAAQNIKITGNMKDQLQRASSSIALNLSEGNAKGTVNEKRHFFRTAYGSLRECQTIFQMEDVTDQEVVKLADKLGASLYKLLNSEIKPTENR